MNTKERGRAHSLRVIDGIVAMPTITSSPAFVAFVSFVVSLRADLGGTIAAREAGFELDLCLPGISQSP